MQDNVYEIAEILTLIKRNPKMAKRRPKHRNRASNILLYVSSIIAMPL